MHVTQIRTHGDALAALVERLDPSTTVPTCPEWTVRALATHLASVTAFFDACCRMPASGGQPQPATPPGAWADVLAWWQDLRAGLTDLFETADPATPAWTPPGFAPVLGSWARRMAHEYAVHRLDLEHAATGGGVPPLFDPQFAADGVDELLTGLLPPAGAAGSVLFWADDVGAGWWLDLSPGAPPAVTGVAEPRDGATVTVRGTADAVYRAAWRRPHPAEVTGARELLAAIGTP